MKITKKYLTERCREILHSYRNGERICDADLDWLINNVFKYHSSWDLKNQPYEYFYIDGNMYGTRCFYIKYKDGTHDDISFVQSIRDKK